MGRVATGAAGIVLALVLGGCSSVNTKITGSARAGSEQLLLTGTADRAIDCIDFRPLAGAPVYLDASTLAAADSGWVTFSLRRAMARQGVLLADSKKDARVVVEAALGAYGTDEVDYKLNLPGSLPNVAMPIATSGLDAHAIVRKNRQDAVVKLALMAFDASTRRLIWESGTILESQALDRRFLGAKEISRWSTLPELKSYPRRKVW